VSAKINPAPVLLTNALRLLKNEKVAALPVPMLVRATPASSKIEFDTVYAPPEITIDGPNEGDVDEDMLPEKVAKFAVTVPPE
jgi:hypothetical protein